MSVIRVIEIKCDGPDGGACPDSAAWTDYCDAADLRQRMRADGWKTGERYGLDQCPQCRPAGSAR